MESVSSPLPRNGFGFTSRSTDLLCIDFLKSKVNTQQKTFLEDVSGPHAGVLRPGRVWRRGAPVSAEVARGSLCYSPGKDKQLNYPTSLSSDKSEGEKHTLGKTFYLVSSEQH